MRKRFFSILTALALCLTLLPTAAFAAADGTDDTGGAPAGMPLTQELIEKRKGSDKSEGIQLLAGDYYLTENVHLVGDDTGAWSLSLGGATDDAFTLDLNGYVLDLRGANICAFRNLTLKDSNTGNQSHKFRVEKSGLWVWDETAGTETVTGGVITGGKGAEDSNGIGGGVYISSGKTFTMNGGSIVGCTAAAGNAAGTFSGIGGGGVYIGGSSGGSGNIGSFTMTGGRIVGCTAGGAGGGGVYIGAGSSFTMNGGSIESCTASSSGGGVYSAGSFTMAGGSIEDCTAANGGGVYSEADFTMEGGSIEGCTANGDGGGVLSDADFTMNGGSIAGCTAANGGGVSIADSKIFTMNGGSIVGCTAGGAGGGVIVKKGTNNKGTFVMNGGSIEDCKMGKDKNSLVPNAIHADGTLTFENGTSIDKSLLTGIKAGHRGTSTDPILIGSVEGLKDFRDRVNGIGNYNNSADPDLCATLVCDIVLNDGTFDDDGTYKNAAGQISTPAQWTPIGSSASNPYKGKFNGNGKTIKGLYVNVINQSQSNEYIYHAGLFGYTDGATIQNVTVDGYVSISGDVTNGNDSTNVGGIVGCAKDTTITGCTNLCTVKSDCSSVESGSFAGGIAGNMSVTGSSGDYSVTNCRNSGKVFLSASDDGLNVGGIAGSSSVPVSNCYNTGGIEVASDHAGHNRLCVGGVVGQTSTDAQLSNCYNTGEVKVTGNYTVDPDASSVGFGGVVGTSGGTVSKCYNTGTVSCGKGNVGGVAGVNHDTSITGCYFLTGTAAEGVGQTINIINGAVSRTYVKAKAEFADGGMQDSVLKLLRGESADSPWMTECGYLAAAGMTLPLLSWQTAGDHTHDYSWQHTDAEHWKECSCGMIEAGNSGTHSGGTATCKEQATCEDCGEKYGALDPNRHVSLTYTAAVAATTTAPGNIEYWYCPDCGKYYANAAATLEIPEADTVIAKLPSGGGSSTPSVADTAAKDIRNAEPGETVRIAMKGETKLPARVLDAAYGKDVTLEIDMGNGAVWTINGLDIPKGGVSLNLGVKTGVTSIPAKVIDAVSGEVSAVQLRLSHDGAFAVRVTLSLMLGKEFDGRFANLYYYNEATGALEFQCSDKIRGGAASWPFAHASEYVIVIDETDHEPMRFADVADGAYYRDAVLWAAKNGITSGISDTAFGPSLPCTRAQIVTFLWRAAGSPVVNYAMRMDDVNEGSYYAEAVRWALSEGITTGTAANAFSPNEPCTRAQAVTFLFRYAAPAAVTLQELVSGYGDADSVPGFARPAMNWALAAGIVQGDGSDLLPNDTCTRGQIVTFLYRALEK